MGTVRIFLRGGGYFDLTADNVTTVRDRFTNTLTKIEWTNGTSGRPLYLRIEAVDAVVELDGEST